MGRYSGGGILQDPSEFFMWDRSDAKFNRKLSAGTTRNFLLEETGTPYCDVTSCTVTQMFWLSNRYQRTPDCDITLPAVMSQSGVHLFTKKTSTFCSSIYILPQHLTCGTQVWCWGPTVEPGQHTVSSCRETTAQSPDHKSESPAEDRPAAEPRGSPETYDDIIIVMGWTGASLTSGLSFSFRSATTGISTLSQLVWVISVPSSHLLIFHNTFSTVSTATCASGLLSRPSSPLYYIPDFYHLQRFSIIAIAIFSSDNFTSVVYCQIQISSDISFCTYVALRSFRESQVHICRRTCECPFCETDASLVPNQ